MNIIILEKSSGFWQTVETKLCQCQCKFKASSHKHKQIRFVEKIYYMIFNFNFCCKLAKMVAAEVGFTLQGG